MFDVNEIKYLRKNLNLTQGQLAKLSGVSQSLIAKVESGLIDPAYSKAQKIFSTLDSLSNKKNLKVENLIVKKIISLSPEDSLKSAITTMKKYEISQAPVIEHNSVVGLISEGIILDSLMKSGDNSTKLREIMDPSPPIIPATADIDAASHLLKYYPLILVSDKGRYIGILTKADLIRNMFNKK